MKKETRSTILPGKSEKCTKTTKMSSFFFLSILTKVLKRSKNFRTKRESVSNGGLRNGLQTSKRKAIREAKKRMKLGGRWGVVKLGEFYCEVERTYFKVHNIKPVWYRKTFKEWLTGQLT